MWRFSFAEKVTDYGQAAAALDRFLRRLSEVDPRSWGRLATRVPFMLILEPHPGGHGYHAHGATDRYLDHDRLTKLWGEGQTWVTYSKAKKGEWSSRRLAGYISKYLGKQLDEEELHGCSPRPAGAHRWFHTEGRRPEEARGVHLTLESGLDWVRRNYGEWDQEFVFGLDGEWPQLGVRLVFPDHVVARYVRAGQGRAQRAGGQP
jgi:hypothetical protein